MTVRSADASMIHLKLGTWFGVLWLLTAFHLLVLMGHEVWDWDWMFITSCAAPPLCFVFALLAGHPAIAAFDALLLAVVVGCWWLAVRRPKSRARVAVAIVVIMAYWVFNDFGLALAA